MQKELDQKVTQLTDEEMGAVNCGDGFLSINEDFSAGWKREIGSGMCWYWPGDSA